MTFKTSGDLADQILDWFRGFPRANEAYRQPFRNNLKRFQSQRWHDQWSRVALPILSSTGQ